MAKNQVKRALRGGLEVDRPDTSKDRQDPASFIAETSRPLLNNREAWAKSAHSRGMSLEKIIEGTGWNVALLFKVLGIDPAEDRRLFERLTEFRAGLYSYRR